METGPGRVLQQRVVGGGVLEVVENDLFRWLHFGGHLRQSCMWRQDPVRLALPYTRHMMAALLLAPWPGRVLLVGLGGGSLVKFLHHHRPACRIEALEVEPAVVEVARDFFHLPATSQVVVRVAEAAAYLREAPLPDGSGGGYDLILVDAFDRQGMARAVYDEGFLTHCHARLAPGGCVALNLFWKEAPIRRGVAAALQALFEPDGVLVLPVAGSSNEIWLARRGGAPPWRELPVLARRMERELGLEMFHFLGQLQRCNRSLWQRWGTRLGWPF